MSHSKLEIIVYGHATSMALSDIGDVESYFAAYEQLCESVANNEEPNDLTAWAPFETWEWSDILEQINTEAECLLHTMLEVLDLAEKGLVKAALNNSLDSDMSQVDLAAMVELGSEPDAEEMLRMESEIISYGFGIYELSNGKFAVADPSGGIEGFYLELSDRNLLITESYAHIAATTFN